ncbi:MAG: alpha/beta hydrolase [Myxococcota bacterium]|nr:alpha/beta hydrolase [Myxococcota bacterium]
MNEHLLGSLGRRERLRVAVVRLLLKRGKRLAPKSWRCGRELDGQVLDGDAEWVFRVRERAGGAPMNLQTPENARRADVIAKLVGGGGVEPMVEVRDLRIPTSAGTLPARLYVPHEECEPGAGLLYFHGGGFVLGSIETHDASVRVLAKVSGTRVLSVDYRRSPEHPFPAPIEDGMEAYAWIQAHGKTVGFESDRVAVGGDSVGGSLATVICHLVKQQGGVMPCFQLLVYPATDRIVERPSWTLFGEGLPLTRDLLNWFMQHYVQGADSRDPRISPGHFEHFEGLPPAHLAIAGFDLLRDEGLAYAEKLKAAEVPVTVKLHSGMFHGFMQTTGIVPASGVALQEIGLALRAGLHPSKVC